MGVQVSQVPIQAEKSDVVVGAVLASRTGVRLRVMVIQVQTEIVSGIPYKVEANGIKLMVNTFSRVVTTKVGATI